MKKMILVLLIAILAFSFCSQKGKEKTGLQQQPLLVKVEMVRQGTLAKYLNYKGTVIAWKTANIAPDVSGRVGRILKKPGDRVDQGELLAVLDMTALELQQKQARAAMAVAQTAYQNAKLNAERMKKMFENKAISQMQYENTQLALDAADTQSKSAKATLDLVDYTLKNAYMKAPFAGVIVAKNMEEGDMINPMMGAGQSILILMDLTRVKITVDVPSEDIEKIQIRQKCRIKISSRDNEVFWGEVYSKNLAADPVSKTFKVEIKIENPGLKIKAGVYADISIEYIRRENVLLLPLSALLAGDSGVMVNDNGIASRRGVTIGVKNGTNFEVLSGVSLNEMVLTEGNYDLKDGTAITLAGDKK